MDLNAYKIETIWKQESEGDEVVLHFSIEEFGFKMDILLEKDGYFPQKVYHKNLLFKDPCPVCDSKDHLCELLTHHNKELLEKLIHHPTFRLRWVMENPNLFKKSEGKL